MSVDATMELLAREAERGPQVSAENVPRPLTPEEIKATLRGEIESATSYHSGKVAQRRKKARDYYLGEKYGDEKDGQSQVVTQEVLETVERVKPSLMRIFTASEHVCRFLPEYNASEPFEVCEERAEQATDYIGRRFEASGGFSVLLTAFHDGLLEALGIVKVEAEKKVTRSRKRYENLSAEEMTMLLSEPGVQPVEFSERLIDLGLKDPMTGEPLPVPVYDVVVVRVTSDPEIVWKNVPPEHFLHSRGASSLDETIPFVADRCRVKKSDLIAMGFDPATVLELQEGRLTEFEEAYQNRYRDEAGVGDRSANRTDVASEEVWLTDCYILLDEDGDGFSERRRILVAGDGGATTILDDQEVKVHPYCDFAPFPQPHQVVGLSVYDIMGQLQRVSSVLTRGMLDFIYLSLAPPTEVLEGMCNPDDLVSRRAGGYIRSKEMGSYMPHPPQNLPPGVFEMKMGIQAEVERRSGVSSAMAMVDPSVGKNQTAQGVMEFMNAAGMRVDLIARVFAETGIKQMFKKALRLFVQHPPKASILRARGKYIPIRPSDWDPEMDVEVDVTLGAGQSGQRVATLASLIEWQFKMREAGLSNLVTDSHLYSAFSKLVREAGFKYPQSFVADPQFAPPKPEPPPDPKLLEQIGKAEKRAHDMSMDRANLILDAEQAEANAKAQMLQASAQWVQAQAAVENAKKKGDGE